MSVINILKPFDNDKNLGRAYNKAISQVPDDEWIVLCDLDVQFLTPDSGNILSGYADRNPGCLLTCLTNRIHPASPQLLDGIVSENADIRHHVQIAEERKAWLYQTIPIHQNISGFLMMFNKSMWDKHKFNENGLCLGVDTIWTNKLIVAGEQIRIMAGLYCWHTYRIMNGIEDKKHLL